jgi:hypothetical protein
VATSTAFTAGVAAGASTATAYNAGVAAGTANTTAAYSAGVAAGSAAAAIPSSYMMGGIYPTLPVGCISPKVNGGTYYLCGNNWFEPSYGAGGVSYRVVAAP